MFIKTFLAAGFALVAAQAHALTLTHAWELNGSTADTMAGPAMVLDDPTGLGAAGYAFDVFEGASVSGTGIGATYSMELRFSFADIAGYAKIIDFKDYAIDDGLYNVSSRVEFYRNTAPYEVTGAPGAFAAATSVHLVLTRDGGTGDVAIYADGALAISFNDASALAVFDAPGGVIRLMRDDGNPNESSAGFLDYVRTYSDVATAADALALANAAASTPVPVPASLPLLAGALGGLAWLRRRKG